MRIVPKLDRLFALLFMAPLLASTAGCQSVNPDAPTNIVLGNKIIRTGVKRFGMNLSGQVNYDSGQMMRDLTFSNPGFEGEIWQTVLQCKFVDGNSCADNDEWTLWPQDFAKGAKFEFFSGAARGQSGIVAGNTPAASKAHQGVWVNFGKLAVPPKVGDFYILRMKFTGNAEYGWRPSVTEGAILSTEMQDLSPKSPGKQALKIDAAKLTQSAGITSDIDTWEGRSFVQLNGTYTLSFRARGLSGTKSITASVTRLASRYGNMTYLTHVVQLTNGWRDYSFTFKGHEDGSFIGPIQVVFSVHAAAVLLDDVSLTESAAPDNPTAFRDAVVNRLRELRPGILRFMDNGTSFGSTLDNLLAPPYARQRTGYSEGNKEQYTIPIGLHEFMVLCKTVHAEPWFTLPIGITPAETRNIIQYFAGSASTPYGAKRAALGQDKPWTEEFPVIHLELGNETWNWGSFPGEGIPEPGAYAARVSDVFSAARAAPLYDPAKFDLIMNGWWAVPWWTEQQLNTKPHADTIDIAPYTFGGFNDASSTEAIFGPMFAEPEAMDSRPTGLVAQNAKLAQKFGVKLAVYEVNLGTTDGRASAEAVESTIPSLGAGLSLAQHLLLMLRDNGIVSQAVFCLPEYANGFQNPDKPGDRRMVKLWGTVVDMGGQTNRSRPTFLATKLANDAIFDKMLETTQTGANPTWDQPESPNGKIKLAGAHYIQSFAFTDGSRTSLVLLNLSRDKALPVAISGASVPHSNVKMSRLTAAKINDTNESDNKVRITEEALPTFDASAYSLPPYSMTVLTWDDGKAKFSTDPMKGIHPVANSTAKHMRP